MITLRSGLAALPLLALALVSLTSLAPAAVPAVQDKQPVRDVSDFNLDKGLALAGYDPVAYFPEGGGKPVKGSKKLRFTHAQVTYQFASQQNLELFRKAPAKYEPVYGGWCAYSMADEGEQVDPDPKNFLIENGRLHLFFKGFFGNGRKAWQKQGAKVMTPKADANWKKILDATRRKRGGGR